MRGPDFFIFGSERGGTTLLSSLLSSHEDVYVVNDSFIFLACYEAFTTKDSSFLYRGAAGLLWRARSLVRRFGPLHSFLFRAKGGIGLGWKPDPIDTSDMPGGKYGMTPQEVALCCKRLMERYTMFQADEREGSFLRRYAQALDPEPLFEEAARGDLYLADFFNRIFLSLVPEDKRTRNVMGEKTPRHFYCSPWMLRLYPHIKNITLIRNPLANIACLHERMGGDLKAACLKYKSFHSGDCAGMYDPARSLLVRYEDLVYRTGDCLARIQEHLGIDCEFKAHIADYSRADYVGAKIDPARDRVRMDYFKEEQRSFVIKENTEILERHYPDLDRIYG